MSRGLRLAFWLPVVALVINALLELDEGRMFAACASFVGALCLALVGGGAFDNPPERGLRPALFIFLVTQAALLVASWIMPHCCLGRQ
ncbi:MAG: hypothetical protein ABI647_03735 [Gemmatimonadota bacterium]